MANTASVSPSSMKRRSSRSVASVRGSKGFAIGCIIRDMTHRRIAPEVRAPRGTKLTCRSWLTEAPFRMIQNNLDPDVAENPEELVVYGGIGRAARHWECLGAILAALRELNDDESLLIQSGKPVGVFKTHADAPRVLIANSNLVPKWATWEHFN